MICKITYIDPDNNKLVERDYKRKGDAIEYAQAMAGFLGCDVTVTAVNSNKRWVYSMYGLEEEVN